MIITIQCITVVLISIFLVGAPLSWLLNGRNWLGEQGWLEAPFLGIAAIILILQNLVYLDLPIRYTALLIWVAGLAGWFWMYRCKQISAVFATLPRALFGTALAVYLLQGLGLLIIGARFYMGRAWGDQYNYTALAQFLTDERFSMSMSEISHRPYLITAISFKLDRIGQSILHSFFATSSLQEAKTLFEPTILLSVALIVLAVYGLGRRFGLQKRYAIATGAVAGLLPAIASVHLESFLSHALTIPLLLFVPVLLDDLVAQLNWRRLSVCAISAAAIVSTYTEFWLILVGLTTLMLGIAALGAGRSRRLLGCWVVLMLAPFALNPFFTSVMLDIVMRINESILTNIYPWALSIEGISRLWLGDLAAASAAPQLLIRTYAVVATVLGYCGLIYRCIIWLYSRPIPGAELEQRRSLTFGLGVLSLAVLPFVVLVRDNQHPYQFYKLLLSISPLLVLGIQLALQPYLSDAAGRPIAAPAQRPGLVQKLPALLVMGVTLVISVVGTTTMVLRSASLQPTERYHGSLLIAPEMQQLQDQLEGLHDKNLFFYESTIQETVFLNSWMAYFARHNQIWLDNTRFNGIDLVAIQEAGPIIDLKTIPPDVLVLSSANKRVVTLTMKKTLLWSNSSYQLWKPDSSSWLVPLKLENQNGVGVADGLPFFWMGQGDTTLDVLTQKSGVLHIMGTFLPGPSVPGRARRELLVMTDAGYHSQFTLIGGDRSISLPVPAGRTKVTLRPLDKPTITARANGDTRPLILGVKGITAVLDDNPVTRFGSIQNECCRYFMVQSDNITSL